MRELAKEARETSSWKRFDSLAMQGDEKTIQRRETTLFSGTLSIDLTDRDSLCHEEPSIVVIRHRLMDQSTSHEATSSKEEAVVPSSFPLRLPRFPLLDADGTSLLGRNSLLVAPAEEKHSTRKTWNSLTSPEATASPGMKSSG